MSEPTQTQAQYWNSEVGVRWTQHQEALDRLLAPLDQAALARAAPRAGEHVLEIGCGCGASTLALAQAVGASGSVLGLDLSLPMLARARERAALLAHVTLREADAGRYDFGRRFQLLYSRFGVMFFEQPVVAFQHLRSALAPEGRFVFVCWRALDENPWFALPLRAAAPHVALPPPAGPEEPGPFSLASQARIEQLLSAAGFTDLRIEPFVAPLVLSDAGLEGAVELVTQAVGPVGRALTGLSAAQRAPAVAAVREALRPHLTGQRVSLPGAVWIVEAR